MTLALMNTFLILLAVAAGGAIGFCFGLIQNLAFRRNQRRQQGGELNSG
jgi:hypothetical protein